MEEEQDNLEDVEQVVIKTHETDIKTGKRIYKIPLFCIPQTFQHTQANILKFLNKFW